MEAVQASGGRVAGKEPARRQGGADEEVGVIEPSFVVTPERLRLLLTARTRLAGLILVDAGRTTRTAAASRSQVRTRTRAECIPSAGLAARPPVRRRPRILFARQLQSPPCVEIVLRPLVSELQGIQDDAQGDDDLCVSRSALVDGRRSRARTRFGQLPVLGSTNTPGLELFRRALT